MNFYDNLYVQLQRFNIFIHPSKLITKLLGVLLYCMDTHSATGFVLHSKISQLNTVAVAYKVADNFLETTTDVVFLHQLLQQIHPLLVFNNVATVNIPNYSIFNNLYKYAKEILHFMKNQGLHNMHYSPSEVPQIFLTHLDDRKYYDTSIQLFQTLSMGELLS